MSTRPITILVQDVDALQEFNTLENLVAASGTTLGQINLHQSHIELNTSVAATQLQLLLPPTTSTNGFVQAMDAKLLSIENLLSQTNTLLGQIVTNTTRGVSHSNPVHTVNF